MKTAEYHYQNALDDLAATGCKALSMFGSTCIPAFNAFSRLYHDHPEYHGDTETNNQRWRVNAQAIVAFFSKKLEVSRK